MKYFPLLLLLAPQLSTAQSFLIPFTNGKLQGLANDKGKILVPAKYDRIKWLTGPYFQTERNVVLNDTIETAPRNFYIQNDKITLTGIFFGDKEILKNEPFSDYEILPGKCIIARSEGTKYRFTKEQFKKYGQLPKFLSLFNLNGENVYPKNFRSLQKVDTIGKLPSPNGHSRYILFAAESMNNGKGLFVYDVLSQEISEWLVEGLGKTKLINADREKHSFSFSDNDGSGYETHYTIFSDGDKFRIEKKSHQEPVKREENIDTVVETINMEGDHHVAVPDITREIRPREADSVLRRRFHPFYTFNSDSLFYVVFTNEKIFIPLPKTHSPIFLRPNAKPIQNMPVITKAKNKYFLADSAGLQQTAYDSMMYFGSNFLVWKKINGKLKCGTIDKKGNVVIPLVYDSIQPGMHLLEIQSARHSDSSFLVLNPYKQPESRGFENGSHTISISQTLVAFKNGLAALVSPSNDTLLTFPFNSVAQNNINFFRPAKTDFMVIEKMGKFGVVKKDRNKMKVEVQPRFPFTPVFYYENYYGIPGLKVYALYDKNFRFRGFGTSDGNTIRP